MKTVSTYRNVRRQVFVATGRFCDLYHPDAEELKYIDIF